MRPLVLTLGGAVAIGLLIAIFGWGAPSGTVEDRPGHFGDEAAFAARVGMVGDGGEREGALDPIESAAGTVAPTESQAPLRGAKPPFSWSAPAEFAPVDPLR